MSTGQQVRAAPLVNEMAGFVANADYEDLSKDARTALRVRVLDTLGCAIGAMGGPPIAMLREQTVDFGGRHHSTLIGGGRTAPDRAALFNGALARYLDFNDSYLAEGETCHPSDNLGAVLAAAEYADASGRDLLAALAVAYQVQCRLSDVAPVRAHGFDHTTQGAYSVAAGTARALGLDAERTAHAIAIAGTAFNALRVTRTGHLSHWKGLAFPNTAFGATHAAFLARRGITGPAEVFEGNKGLMDAITGPFEIDWATEDLKRVTRTFLKKYNAEVHSQSAIEGALELQAEHGFRAEEVERVEIDIFDVAYHIIGGGEEGDKTEIRRKEEADHSLPYMVAVALLDGDVLPAQYAPDRIIRSDVQDLLRRVAVRPSESHTRRFPERHACTITIALRDGRELHREKEEYEGFVTRPMSWDTVREKFDRLTEPHTTAGLRDELAEAVRRLAETDARTLAAILARVGNQHQQETI